MLKKGILISVEGPDGSGKSTQINLLKNYIEKNNLEAVIIREPGGTSISEEIRNILLDPKNSDMDFMTEVLLYAASRAQLVNQVIIPALKENKVVICDRYFDSSYAYQGYGRDMYDFVDMVNRPIVKDAIPDLTILLMLDLNKSKNRIYSNRDCVDRIEAEGDNFHQKVIDGYMNLAERNKERYLVLDANMDIESIRKKIIDRFNQILNIEN